MNRKKILLKRIYSAVVLVLSTAVFISCEKYSYDPPKLDPNAQISFQNDIIPIFDDNCKSCHGGAISPDLRPDKAYNSLINGNYINTSNPESSSLYVKVVSAGHSSKTTDIQKQQILAWIKQGAQNN